MSIQIGKKEIKLSLIADDMRIYLEIYETHKIVTGTNKLSKVAGNNCISVY